MPTDVIQLRTDSYQEVGTAIQREAGQIIRRWESRARIEQPNASRVHHDVLLDHLAAFLAELGRTLASATDEDLFRHCKTAVVHGDQRWETGWSIAEVVRDYQILRVVLVDFLQEFLERMLTTKEVMALGLVIDDAIGASVSTYLACVNEAVAAEPSQAAADGQRDIGQVEILGVFGVLGHELRNSLAPLANSLHVLEIAGADPSTVEKTRQLMARQVALMARLVEDLMDVPRLARDKVSLKSERLDLCKLVRESAEDRHTAFHDAGITLVVDIASQPLWTVGDPARLNQVLGNLLNNALKFTNRGGSVRVSLQVVPELSRAEIRVCDNGIGIDPHFLPNIFEAFSQLNPSNERGRGGLGLGLALVKGLVELHGGRVAARSEGLGTGTEITVELPVADYPSSSESSGQTGIDGATAIKRVLVIDDNRDLAESTRMVLELRGHKVQLAHTGKEGVAVALATEPHVIICDIELPELNGYDVCLELCKLPVFQSALKIALSGHGSNSSRTQALAAGFDVFLLKPVAPEKIAAIVANFGSSLDKCST
ncbi:MAG: ATP-binding protein [Planctomycetaceae bacterium]